METWVAVFGIFGIIGGLLGIPGIIAWMLGRKDANKKLEIEEGGLNVTQFNSIINSYKGIAEAAEASAASAKESAAMSQAAAEAALAQLKENQVEVTELRSKLSTVRDLFTSVLKRNGITMTAEELKLFEETSPAWRRPARRK